MLQNWKAPQVSCNFKDHQDQYVSAICTRKECEKQSPLCQKCMLLFHKHCEDQITYLGDLPNKVNNFKGVIESVVQIFESLIKQLRAVQQSYQKSLQPILAYEEIQNMTNLNTLGKMFREQQRINLDSIKKGNEQITEIIQKYFAPFGSNQLELQKAEEWSIKGKEHCDKKEFQEGLECIEKALKLNPNSDVILTEKGSALRNLDRQQEAIQCCDAALKINPKNDSAWFNKGWALGELNRFEEAIQCCDTALEINPNDDLAWNNKGAALNYLGEFKEAIQCFDAALKINPNNHLAQDNKKYSLDYLEKQDETIQGFDVALKINQSSKLNKQRKLSKQYAQSKYKCKSDPVPQDEMIYPLFDEITLIPIQIAENKGDNSKIDQNLENESLIEQQKHPDNIQDQNLINQNLKNQQKLKYQLIESEQPDKNFLLEPNSFFQGDFDIQNEVKYKNGKIILRKYDSNYNQSFLTYEGQFQNNTFFGFGKQFWGKSSTLCFQGEWNSQGKIESTGQFYDGAGNKIPNPNSNLKPRSSIKIISIQDTNPNKQVESWNGFDQLYYERDLKILQGNGWLNSSIIDGYIKYLNYIDEQTYWEMDDRQNYKRMLIIPSYVFSYLHKNSSEMNKQTFQKEFYEFEPIKYRFWKIFNKIAFVINNNNFHWYFVILDFQQKIMIVQDSMQSRNNHYQIVKKILEELFSDEELKIEFKIQIDRKCPQQNNGYDCGTFVCLNAKRLFLSGQCDNQSKIVINKNTTNPKIMRQELYKFIKDFQNNQNQ